MFRAAALRPALSAAPRARLQVRFATQDYGSGEGNPAGEKPEKQGKNPSENLEHPGPPPPKVAQGKTSHPDEQAPNKSQSGSTSEASGGNEGKSSGGNSKKGAPQPKILNEKPPAEESESVRQHNEEMENRAEKAHEQIDNEDAKNDKVHKGFWAGESIRFFQSDLCM